jgi:hypothetical protein
VRVAPPLEVGKGLVRLSRHRFEQIGKRLSDQLQRAVIRYRTHQPHSLRTQVYPRQESPGNQVAVSFWRVWESQRAMRRMRHGEPDKGRRPEGPARVRSGGWEVTQRSHAFEFAQSPHRAPHRYSSPDEVDQAQRPRRPPWRGRCASGARTPPRVHRGHPAARSPRAHLRVPPGLPLWSEDLR